MNQKKHILTAYLPYFVILLLALYALVYYDYFETPSADYIGNFRPRVLEYINGFFPGSHFKILPLYPLVLSFFSKVITFTAFDHIYIIAITLNYILFIPYLIITFKIYSEFLSRRTATIALLFLGINGFTIYTAANAELEMLLSFLIVLTVYLTLKNSTLRYFTAFLTTITKWDAVFIIPAVMFKDFFVHNKKIKSIVLGSAASLGFLVWMLMGIIPQYGMENPYINEISRRGPNIYRYLIDTVLVSSGFGQWMATHVYLSELPFPIQILLFVFIAVIVLLVATCMIHGIIKLLKDKGTDILPLMIFFAGFVLVHMVYQNTKSRYVLPVLWLQYLCIFYGISKSDGTLLHQKITAIADSLLKRKALSLVLCLIALFMYCVSLYALYKETAPWYVFLMSFIFIIPVVYTLSEMLTKKKYAVICTSVLLLAVIINCNVLYTSRMMDHYSLRRVEFKKAALWYRNTVKTHDKMLITECNVALYYSGFSSDRFVASSTIRSTTIDEMIMELKKKKINLIFIDDFYITRLRFNDKNALEKKASLLKDLKDSYMQYSNFTLVKVFKTGDSIRSYVLRFSP